MTGQSGSDIAIDCQGNSQSGFNNIALGSNSGTTQVDSCIAIGPNTGMSQQSSPIATGGAGSTSQGNDGIALGRNVINPRARSIAIGRHDGAQVQDVNCLLDWMPG